MRIVAKSTLLDYAKSYADAADALDAWFADAAEAKWATPRDVTDRYANASILAGNRICFNIRGNHYRLIVGIDYRRQIVFIKWFGTHADYNRIDAEKIEHQG